MVQKAEVGLSEPLLLLRVADIGRRSKLTHGENKELGSCDRNLFQNKQKSLAEVKGNAALWTGGRHLKKIPSR
jgi:hypothetical protein